jgi:hypothetical protein
MDLEQAGPGEKPEEDYSGWLLRDRLELLASMPGSRACLSCCWTRSGRSMGLLDRRREASPPGATRTRDRSAGPTAYHRLMTDGNHWKKTAPQLPTGGRRTSRLPCAYAHLTVTGISRGRARSALGMVTVRMPFAELASIFSGSTVVGSANVRSKVP